MGGGCTYYWSSCSDEYHSQGVVEAVFNKLTPMAVEATPVNRHIMRMRIRHSIGVISLVAVCASTKASDLTGKDTFCATLESVIGQCPKQNTLLSLGVHQCIDWH